MRQHAPCVVPLKTVTRKLIYTKNNRDLAKMTVIFLLFLTSTIPVTSWTIAMTRPGRYSGMSRNDASVDKKDTENLITPDK